MSDLANAYRRCTRRSFLGTAAGFSLGPAALDSLLADRRTGDRPAGPPPRVKRVIHLCMAGGMSHLESFDHKPKLREMNGEPMPESYTAGKPIAQLQNAKQLRCLGPSFGFRRHGESGQEISDVFPFMAKLADRLAIVRSLRTKEINHDPAHTFMNTGTSISGRPSMGSWLSYGIGAECDDLPAYVVLTSVGRGGQSQPISARQWHSGFLPSQHQGVQFQAQGDPVHYVGNPPGVDRGAQRALIDAIATLDRQELSRTGDREIATRLEQYELAFRMQQSVPELVELSNEPEAVFDMYGTRGGDGSYASNCLLARRLAERGVRFIQLYHRSWDQHGNIKGGFATAAREVDRATTALVLDLEQRGLLDETLIIFGSEFGRTPMAQGSGRDHHIQGFSAWLCGGGVKGGITHGATDELGYAAVTDIVEVHDLHATMLHLCGIDHERLTYRFQGRDFRLTDVAGRVVHALLA